MYLEVLSCQNLPNKDIGGDVGNVSDPFVTAVYEDAVMQTSVIDNELSPQWPPWTKRAVCFNIMRSSSILYLAVFDYDLASQHDPIGRVAINVNNLKHDTVYLLKYNLCSSSNISEGREKQGTITIRLRIEINNLKAALLEGLKPRPTVYINVKKEKSFRVLRYTCFGKHDHDEEDFNATVMKSYVYEALEYKSTVLDTIGNALHSLMFWRGQVRIFSWMLPLHSLLFFCMGVVLVENPHMFPSFLLSSVAWVLLATNTVRVQHPSPWKRCIPFFIYLEALVGFNVIKGKQHIDAYEGWRETEELEIKRKKQIEENEEVAKATEEKMQRLQELRDENLLTQVGGNNLIPLEVFVRLGKYQAWLGEILKKMRMAKIIILWEDTNLSFWTTTISLVVGIFSLFLPWAFILTFTGRAVIWGAFGPHMKIVDYMLTRSKTKNEEVKIQDSKSMIVLDKYEKLARIRREETVKLKAAKCLRFGKYMIKVPSFNLAWYFDYPLPESTAKPWKKDPVALDIQKTRWLPKQQLFGTMIPRPEKLASQNKDQSKRKKKLMETQLEKFMVT